MRTFVDVEEALLAVLGTSVETAMERVPLAEAVGRTLAAAATSDMDLPPFANSAMDGFAVRAEDLPAGGVVLPVSGSVRAGSWPDGRVEPGTCWRITTGAPLPEGADAIVPVEETEPVGPQRIRFRGPSEPGRHIRHAARDVARGQTVLEPGTAVTPAVAGMLAMVGVVDVPVRKRPTVSIVATGDEIVPPEDTPGPGQIRDSNSATLAAQARASGACVLHVVHARDEAESTREALSRTEESDIVVFSGGVSMGTHDVVRDVLETAGLEWLFWKVRQRPGKPLAFGRLGDRRVFGLPGNPVSSSVCFDQYVRPLALRMQGRSTILRPRYAAVLEQEIPKPPGLHVFARGVAERGSGPELRVRPTGPQGSNLFTSVVRANCLVHLPAGLEAAPAGTPVDIEWLTW